MAQDFDDKVHAMARALATGSSAARWTLTPEELARSAIQRVEAVEQALRERRKRMDGA